MYAIVEIAGLQYKVEQDQQIYVNRLQGEEGDKLSFDRVMLTDDSGNVTVGAPVIEGVAVNATILKHLKGDKVLVFKKKRRKGYQKLNGHRQYLTQISIDGFGKPTAKPKKETKKAEAPKAEQPTVEKPKAEPVKKEVKASKKGRSTQSRGCRLQQHDGGRIKSTSKRARYNRVLVYEKGGVG
jgi:large subunit ribosomal protein L21